MKNIAASFILALFCSLSFGQPVIETKVGNLSVSGTAQVTGQTNAGIVTATAPGGSLTVGNPPFQSVDSTALAADIGGGISFGGNYTGSTKTNWAGIAGLKLNATAGDYSGYLAFYTRNNGSPSAEVLRLNQTGSMTVTSPGPHAIGGAANTNAAFSTIGTFAGAGVAVGIYESHILTPGANVPAYGAYIQPTINKSGSGTHPDFTALQIDPPAIGAGAATLTNATTLKIAGAPSVGTNQRALWIAAGRSDFDAAIVTGTSSTIGIIGSIGYNSVSGNYIYSKSGSSYDFVLYSNAGQGGLIMNAARTFQMPVYGAGAATFDASGNITSVSDERVKTHIRPFMRGYEAIKQINPILHGYTKASGLDQSRDDYAGFSAQNVKSAIPEAIGQNADGMYSLNDRPIVAALVNVVKSQHAAIRRLEKRLSTLERGKASWASLHR